MERMEKKECDACQSEVALKIPLLPDMVRIVRLTASGIANMVGFEMDEIEDIKVAVAEVCNRLIIVSSSYKKECVVIFRLTNEGLSIHFEFNDDKPDHFELFNEDDIFGLAIVNSLMDEVALDTSTDSKGIITLHIWLKEC